MTDGSNPVEQNIAVGISEKDKWDCTIKLLEHYQTVLNQRFVWMTTVQGFIFTVFALTVNAATHSKNEATANLLWTGVMLICVLGAVAPWAFVRAIARYGELLDGVRQYWKQLSIAGFPPLTREPLPVWYKRIETLPALTSIGWLIAIGFSLTALGLETSTQQELATSPTSTTEPYWIFSLKDYWFATVSALIGSVIGILWTIRHFRSQELQTHKMVLNELRRSITFNLDRLVQAKGQLTEGEVPTYRLDTVQLTHWLSQSVGLLDDSLIREIDWQRYQLEHISDKSVIACNAIMQRSGSAVGIISELRNHVEGTERQLSLLMTRIPMSPNNPMDRSGGSTAS